MKVIVRSGTHKGITGEIRGDLAERTKTLGKDGKVLVRGTGKPKPNDMILIRCKHLDASQSLFEFDLTGPIRATVVDPANVVSNDD